MSSTTKTRIYVACEIALLAAVIAAGVLTSRADDWKPIYLVGFLLFLTAFGQTLIIPIRMGVLSGAFISLVLAMSLLGPAPAVALGMSVIFVSSLRRRLHWQLILNNVVTLATYPLVGALVVRATIGDVHGAHNVTATKSITF